MVQFVGAGPGAADLITVRGMCLLGQADIIIYAGSLVNPDLLTYAKKDCKIYDSSTMTLEEVIAVIRDAHAQNAEVQVVRLHTGDSSLYGAIREQMDALDELKIPYATCPGVSSFCGAAATLNLEYTLPDVSQSVVITRESGRTPVPERESIASFAAHRATMVLFLSTALAEKVQADLLDGGYPPDTPVAIVYKATWPDEQTFFCTIATLPETLRRAALHKTALIIVGAAVTHAHYRRSDLYNPSFSTEYRAAMIQRIDDK